MRNRVDSKLGKIGLETRVENRRRRAAKLGLSLTRLMKSSTRMEAARNSGRLRRSCVQGGWGRRWP